MENPNANQKETFNKLLEEYNNQLPENKKEYFVITEEKYHRIVSALSLAKGSKCLEGTKFKF
jgi:hypothetical protein